MKPTAPPITDDHQLILNFHLKNNHYISKADGKVSQSEIIVAQQVMEHMQLSEDMIKVAKDLFNQ